MKIILANVQIAFGVVFTFGLAAQVIRDSDTQKKKENGGDSHDFLVGFCPFHPFFRRTFFGNTQLFTPINGHKSPHALFFLLIDTVSSPKSEAFPRGKASSDGTLDANRTRDLLFRKESLYPTELRGPLPLNPLGSGNPAKSVVDYRVDRGAFQFFMAI